MRPSADPGRVFWSFMVIGTGWMNLVAWVTTWRCGHELAWHLRLAAWATMGTLHLLLSTSLGHDMHTAWRRWRALRAEKYPSHKPSTF